VRRVKGEKDGNLPWDDIDTVLLDMDGTLLDKHFDDYFWEQYLPEHYSLRHDLGLEQARAELLARYQRTAGSLLWADLDHWSRELGFDLVALKEQLASLIVLRPRVESFLDRCRQAGKQLYLVTNAHHRTLALKLGRVDLASRLDRIVHAGSDAGRPELPALPPVAAINRAKEEPEFWLELQGLLAFDPARSLLVDDSEAVLATAASCGIRHLRHIARPSSRLPARFSPRFPSIEHFDEIMPPLPGAW